MTLRAVVLRCVAIFGVAVLTSVALAMQETGVGLRPNDEGVHFFNQHALEDPSSQLPSRLSPPRRRGLTRRNLTGLREIPTARGQSSS
jgi:hypothetical protein